MELALILRELASRRAVLAAGIVVATLAAILSVYRLDGFKLKPRSLQFSSATTQVFIDTPSSVLGNLTQSFDPLQARATVYANFMASPEVLNEIGQKAGIPGDQLYAAGPIDPLVPRIVEEPTAVQRNVEITGETDPYRLNFNNDPDLPTIGIYAQAPTTAVSIRLANAAVAGLKEYVAGLQSSEKVPPTSRVVIRQLGQPTGGVVDSGIKKSLAVMVFIGVFLLWSVLALAYTRFRAAWRASAIVARDVAEAPAPPRQVKAPQKAANGKPGNGRTPVAAPVNGPRASLRRYRGRPEQEKAG
jgi:hypothetical protein